MTDASDTGEQPGEVILPCGRRVPPCCVIKLMVACGHSKRGFLLNIPGKPTRDKDYVIQMLADDTPTVTGSSEALTSEMRSATCLQLRDLARIHLIGGPCRQGHPSRQGPGVMTLIPDSYSLTTDFRPVVSVTGADVAVTSPSPYSVSVYGPEVTFEPYQDPDNPLLDNPMTGPALSLEIGLFEFLIKFFSWSEPQSYTVGVYSCSNVELSAIIEVFPKQSWNGSFSVGWNGKAGLEFAVNLAAKFGDKNITVRPPIPSKEDALKKVGEIVSKIKELVDAGGKPNEKTNTRGSWKINYPAFAVSGKLENVEDPGQCSVGWEGQVSLAAKPFIGAAMEGDLLDFFIEKFSNVPNPVTAAILKVALLAKQRARESGVADIALVWKLEGGIEGEISWKIQPPAKDKYIPNWKADKCSGGGKITGTLEGLVEVKTDFWNLAAGAHLGAQSSVYFKMEHEFEEKKEGESEKKTDPFFKYYYGWDGVKIFYSSYIRKIKGSESGSAPESKKSGEGGEQGSEHFTVETEEKDRIADKGSEVVLFSGFHHPSDPEKTQSLSTGRIWAKSNLSGFLS